MNLKNIKAGSLLAAMFKTRINELVRCMHQLVHKIWVEESMPNDWNLSLLCPVLKKGDPTLCANYRGTSLLISAY